MEGLRPGHLLLRYSPCMICCSNSVVRGMFVALADYRRERERERGLWGVLNDSSTLLLCFASYLGETPI
jgi:hypothetical protein